MAKVELEFWKAKGYSAQVMGGFVRDSRLGRPVKDMDLYLVPNKHSPEDIERDAKEFYEARGHEYILHQKIEDEFREELPEDAPPYNVHLCVYQSQNVAEGDFPVDLIFTPNNISHDGQFDLAICEEYIHVHPFDPEKVMVRRSNAATRDELHNTITILSLTDSMDIRMRGWRELTEDEFNHAYRRLKGHLDRVLAKYPERRLVMDNKTSTELNKVYAHLIEDGYFVQAGEILPTQAGIAERDAVRQLDREELVRLVRGDEDADEVQTRARPVRDPAQVPAGFFDVEVAEILRRARQWGNPGVPAEPAPEPEPAPDTPIRAARRTRNTVPTRNNGPRDAFGNLR